MFRFWLHAFEKRQSLKFLETNLDMTRMRIAFARVQNFHILTNENSQIIQARRQPNLVKQCFMALKSFISKSNMLE